jgi:hypothetical protein
MYQPKFPIYIPSKSRSESSLTAHFLESINVPFRIVIEEQQYADYNRFFPAEKLLILDPKYQEEYDTFDEFGGEFSRGSGPARNFIWEHSIAEGHEFHWIMDDNIQLFAIMQNNQRIPVGDAMIFQAMEEFVLRYENVGMAGPNYWMFAPSRAKFAPFTLNTRIYSCILIRNDVPLRWRGRYNEDTDLSLRMLKNGWATVLFKSFLQYKMTTQQMGGGNTEAFYSDKGTLPKSEMLREMHPDVTQVVWRFKRWHHFVDYTPFKDLGLIRKAGVELPAESQYQLQKVKRNRHKDG